MPLEKSKQGIRFEENDMNKNHEAEIHLKSVDYQYSSIFSQNFTKMWEEKVPVASILNDSLLRQPICTGIESILIAGRSVSMSLPQMKSKF